MQKAGVATIGFFDGVHLGHQKLISIVKKVAAASNYKSILFTFNKTLKSENLIYSFRKKIEILKSCNLDKIIVLDFWKIKNLTPQMFFEKFIIKNKIKLVIVGRNFRFGKDASGGTKELIELSHKYKVSLGIIKNVKIKLNTKSYSVSSSMIRNKILKSKFEYVNKLLNRDYYIEGFVTKGYGIGSKLLGVPTLNISPKNLVLPRGVILGITEIDQKKFYSIANFGFAPTFKKKYFSVEIHILNKSINIKNNRTIKFYPIKKIRNEKFFSSVSSLKKCILNDIKKASLFFRSYKID
ncbi:MAG: riboflavin kinase [Endomicrobiia bacterium]